MSSIAPTTARVCHSSVASPQPHRPGWSVSTLTKIQLRMRAWQTCVSMVVIFMREFVSMTSRCVYVAHHQIEQPIDFAARLVVEHEADGPADVRIGEDALLDEEVLFHSQKCVEAGLQRDQGADRKRKSISAPIVAGLNARQSATMPPTRSAPGIVPTTPRRKLSTSAMPPVPSNTRALPAVASRSAESRGPIGVASGLKYTRSPKSLSSRE